MQAGVRSTRLGSTSAARLDLSMGKHLIALFQGVSRNGAPAHNLGSMKEQMRKASTIGAEIIIFPELFLTGYQLSQGDMKRLAEEKGGASFQELSAAAQEAGIAVVYGYPEVDESSGGKLYYNSAQLIDKDGRSLLNHRKVHIWLVDDDLNPEAVFTPGDQFSVVECCGLKVGLLVCYDVEFPESVRALALRGAQLVAVPTAIVPGSGFHGIVNHMIPSRAMENQVYVAYSNHTGGDFCGGSVCCDPSGGVVVKVWRDETLLLASIDANFKVQRSYLDDRRPSTYKDFVV